MTRPCPFNGCASTKISSGIDNVTPGSNTQATWYWVECCVCGARGPRVLEDPLLDSALSRAEEGRLRALLEWHKTWVG